MATEGGCGQLRGMNLSYPCLKSMVRRVSRAVLFGSCAAVLADGPIFATETPASVATAIAGRVTSAESGSYLRNARVAIEGTTIETLTNETGEFIFSNLPAGSRRLLVSYTGMTPVAVTVAISPPLVTSPCR